MTTVHGSKKRPISVEEMRARIPNGGVYVIEKDRYTCLVRALADKNTQCRVDISSLDLDPDPEAWQLEPRTPKPLPPGEVLHIKLEDLRRAVAPEAWPHREQIRVSNVINALYGLPSKQLPYEAPMILRLS